MGGSSSSSAAPDGSGGSSGGSPSLIGKMGLDPLGMTNKANSIGAQVGKGAQAAQQQSGPPAWAVPYLKGAMGSAQTAFKSGAGAVAPFTPDQQASMDSLRQYAASGANGMVPSMQSTYNYLTNPALLDPNSNPYLKGSVNAAISPMLQNYKDTVLPGINTDAVNGGVFGGSRQGVAQGLASNSLMQDIGNTSASMYSDAYQKGLSTMMEGLKAGPGIAAAGEIPGDILGQIGKEEQAQDQAVSDQPWTQLQKYAGVLSPLFGGAGTVSTQSQPQPTGIQNAASLAAIAAAIVGMFG